MTSTGRTGGRRRQRWTLRRRLVVVLVTLVAVVAAVMGTVTALALRGSLIAQIDERLASANARAERAPEIPRDQVQQQFPDGQPPAAGLQLGQAVGTVNAFVPADGSTTRSSYIDDAGHLQSPLPADVTDALLALPSDGLPRGVTLPGLGEFRAVVTTTDGGDTIATALPTASVTATVTQYVVVEAVVAGLALLAAAAAGVVLVRKELRPLDRVAATATRVASLPLDRGEVVLADRVPAADTDPDTEVGQVGLALNRMLRHVEGALAARQESESQVRQFVADASHELRTPLASIRGYAELVRRSPEELPAGALQAMARVESESLRMTDLVEDLLLLARLDAGRPLEAEPVDVAALAIDAVTDAHAAGPDHAWRLDLPADPADDELTVDGDDHRLRQVLANLLTNARVHTPAGTVVTVRVRRDGDDVVAQVHDDGPGVPAALREHVFDRFSRGDSSRGRTAGSTGLGLSIAHAVVTAHGGRVSLDDGPGTTFTVRLPATGTGPAPDVAPRATAASRLVAAPRAGGAPLRPAAAGDRVRVP